MPSIRLDGKHGFNVQFSPFFPQYIACASSENYGLKGGGYLLILENDRSDQLKLRKSSGWSSGLLDVSWLKTNENIIVTSSCDGSIQLWKIYGRNTLHPLKVYKEHTLDVAAIDSNYEFVASGSWDSSVKIWDLNRTSSVTTLKTTQGLVHSVKWSPTCSNLLLSVSNNYHLALWDRNFPTSPIHRVEPQNSMALDCDWCRYNQNEIAVCGNDGAVRLWDIRRLKGPRLIMTDLKPIGRLRWSPHHPNIIATTSYDLSTSIWDINKGYAVEMVRHHSGFIFGLDFNTNVPGEIADCGLDTLIHVFTPWSLLEFNRKPFVKNKL